MLKSIYLLRFISQSVFNPLHYILKSFSPDRGQLKEELMRSSRKYLDRFVSHWASPEMCFHEMLDTIVVTASLNYKPEK